MRIRNEVGGVGGGGFPRLWPIFFLPFTLLAQKLSKVYPLYWGPQYIHYTLQFTCLLIDCYSLQDPTDIVDGKPVEEDAPGQYLITLCYQFEPKVTIDNSLVIFCTDSILNYGQNTALHADGQVSTAFSVKLNISRWKMNKFFPLYLTLWNQI